MRALVSRDLKIAHYNLMARRARDIAKEYRRRAAGGDDPSAASVAEFHEKVARRYAPDFMFLPDIQECRRLKREAKRAEHSR